MIETVDVCMPFGDVLGDSLDFLVFNVGMEIRPCTVLRLRK